MLSRIHEQGHVGAAGLQAESSTLRRQLAAAINDKAELQASYHPDANPSPNRTLTRTLTRTRIRTRIRTLTPPLPLALALALALTRCPTTR